MHRLAAGNEIASAACGFGQAAQVHLGRAAADADDEDAVMGFLCRLDQGIHAMDLTIGDEQDVARGAVTEFDRRGQCALHLGAAQIGIELPDPSFGGELCGGRDRPQRAGAVLNGVAKA